MIIIGISGKKGSGKDLFSHFLCEQLIKLGFTVTIRAFADPLKKCCGIISGQPTCIFYSQTYKNRNAGLLNMTNRKLMQKFGDLTRLLDPNIWINLALEPVKSDILIISDVRFKNEAEAIKNKNGLLVRINSNRAEKDNHISEIDLDNYNFELTVTNNIGVSLNELMVKAKDTAEYIKRWNS